MVVCIRGTSSHDAEGSVNPLDKLGTFYPVYVADRPEQIMYCPDDGFVLSVGPGYACCEKVKYFVSCLPSLTKSNLMAYASGPTSETTREIVDLMRDMFKGWGIVNERAGAAGIPTILVGHGAVAGSQLSTGQIMTGRDLEWSTGDLKLARCDLYCLGHIHKMQSWGNIYYSGSITRLNYGETEEKGFYIHKLSNNCNPAISHFIETPARAMKTKRTEGLPTAETLFDIQEGDCVRIMYTVNEEDIGKVDEEELRRIAIEKGAVDVKIEKVIVPTVRVRAEGISREHALLAKLLKWAETTEIALNGNVSHKLDLLETMEVEQVLEGYKGVQA